MPLWQIALIVLVGAWALQAVGTYMQMRHYREVMSAITARWGDGYLGTGSAKSTLGRGVILLLVVDPTMIVRGLQVMRGRSVFATFKPVVEVEGETLAALRARAPFDDAAREKAFRMAVEQVEKAARSKGAPKETMAAA